MKPKFLGEEEPDIKGQDRRKVFAEWLTAPDNPFFARNVANRIWAHFFGIGIVEPVDDVRVSNPASNPELLDALAAKLVEYNYDFKRLVRDNLQLEHLSEANNAQRQAMWATRAISRTPNRAGSRPRCFLTALAR